jgi:hypothetical protein
MNSPQIPEDFSGSLMVKILGLALLACLFHFLGWCQGKKSGRDEVQKEAVKVGMAQYTVDDNLNVQFEWKSK